MCVEYHWLQWWLGNVVTVTNLFCWRPSLARQDVYGVVVGAIFFSSNLQKKKKAVPMPKNKGIWTPMPRLVLLFYVMINRGANIVFLYFYFLFVAFAVDE